MNESRRRRPMRLAPWLAGPHFIVAVRDAVRSETKDTVKTMISHADLEALLGKHISAICPRGYSSDSDNHCAHFVSHVLGYKVGATCATMSSSPGDEASIRVHEIFARCNPAGAWSTLDPTMFWGLVFITDNANVNLQARTMINRPKKHIGIFLGVSPQIWHYSNSKKKVVRQTPEEFAKHYPRPDNALFWGTPL